jgi:hypothetical protein
MPPDPHADGGPGRQGLTDAVLRSFDGCPDPRLRQVMTGLVRHLHQLTEELELTDEEWMAAIEFLTATGQWCDHQRQEFILLSDVLGVSMLVETITNRAGDATESTVEGPFHMVDSPPRELGANIALDGKGEPCLVTGTVKGVDGTPLPGAAVDVCQANADGFYDDRLVSLENRELHMLLQGGVEVLHERQGDGPQRFGQRRQRAQLPQPGPHGERPVGRPVERARGHQLHGPPAHRGLVHPRPPREPGEGEPGVPRPEREQDLHTRNDGA